MSTSSASCVWTKQYLKCRKSKLSCKRKESTSCNNCSKSRHLKSFPSFSSKCVITMSLWMNSNCANSNLIGLGRLHNLAKLCRQTSIKVRKVVYFKLLIAFTYRLQTDRHQALKHDELYVRVLQLIPSLCKYSLPLCHNFPYSRTKLQGR